MTEMIDKDALKWHDASLFDDSSFYNLCMPIM